MGDLITTTAELSSACDAARAGGYLSLDTEFVSRQTYYPNLGIVQLATIDGCCAVDCMKGLDRSCLGAALSDKDIVKILHDARQDLTLLRRFTGANPLSVFDTQLAAAFAGFRSGIGLQQLLFEAMDIGLPKTETCSDWTSRPLSDAQIRYALDDVRHLAALRDELLRRAGSFGTRPWLEEEMACYNEASLYEECPPEEMWRRVKLRHARLDRRGFAVLRSVAAVRESLAREWNLPRRARQLRLHYDEAIAAALGTEEEQWPEDPRVHYIPEVLDAADDAVEWLSERATALHVDPGAIANRATVTAFVDNVDDESNPLSHGWRWDAVGRDMAERFGVD